MAFCKVWGTERLNFGITSFNISLADLFLICSHIDIAKFANDNTPYPSAKNVEDNIESLDQHLCSDGLKTTF